MRRSLRDRILTPQVARAITSPLGIVVAGIGAAGGILVGGPLLGVVAGLGAWAARVAVAVPRDEAGPLIEPRVLSQPWRGYVERALAQRGRFWQVAERSGTGPLGQQLRLIAGRVDAGVGESWEVAQRGHALSQARGAVPVLDVQRQLDQTRQWLTNPGLDAETRVTYERTIEALEAQVASAKRMENVIGRADAQLRLLDARLGEAVARVAELSSGADTAALGSVGDDVDGVVTEMEALRQALEEVGSASIRVA